MRNLLKSRFNVCIEPPKTGINSIIWKTGILITIPGIIIMFVGGIPSIIRVLRFGLATETPIITLWLRQFGSGLILAGSDVAILAYLISRLQENQTEVYSEIRTNRRPWYLGGIVSVIFGPQCALLSSQLLDAPPWLPAVPVVFGTLLVLAFEVIYISKANVQSPKTLKKGAKKWYRQFSQI